jgi:hypothetical protein
VRGLDHPRDAADLVAAAVSAIGLVEHGVFVEDFIDRCTSTPGIILFEHVICAQGSGGFVYTDFILIIGGQEPKVANLNVLLESDTDDPDGAFQVENRHTYSESFAQVFRIHNDVFAVASPKAGRLLLVDLAAQKPVRDAIKIPNDAAVLDVRLSNDGNHIVQLNTNGDFFVYALADGRQVLIGHYVEGETIIATEAA